MQALKCKLPLLKKKDQRAVNHEVGRSQGREGVNVDGRRVEKEKGC